MIESLRCGACESLQDHKVIFLGNDDVMTICTSCWVHNTYKKGAVEWETEGAGKEAAI
jgi:hypothetical protein